jgi:hypothetical protein
LQVTGRPARIEPWRIGVCLFVVAYLALCVATDTAKSYHWFLLALIPAAVTAGGAGKRFLIDWAPLFAFWLTYDRLRLAQPFLLPRVAVRAPYDLECALFGWMCGGGVPAHAARGWLAERAAEGAWWASGASGALQFVYWSHLFAAPLIFLAWWVRGEREPAVRKRFHRFVRALTILNFSGVALYLLYPAAPPWWVSAYGFRSPTPELLQTLNPAAGMDGALLQRTIATAPNKFAAIPSLHGAYYVLFALVAAREGLFGWTTFFFVYGAAMWCATVVLNQHYVIDLLAGAATAAAAFAVSRKTPRLET